jgi:hypothetical protein
MVKVVPFRRDNIDILAHYATRKGINGTTQFRDCCINAFIFSDVELKLDWVTKSNKHIESIKAPGKPIACVQLPRAPMGRSDGFGLEILPDCRVIQRAIDRLKKKYTIVQIGAGECLYKFDGIDFDLSNKTTVRELIDIASVADLFVGYCSFILALSESLKKPSIMVWSRAGLNSKDAYIRRIKPSKIIEYQKITKYIIDDCEIKETEGIANEFL